MGPRVGARYLNQHPNFSLVRKMSEKHAAAAGSQPEAKITEPSSNLIGRSCRFGVPSAVSGGVACSAACQLWRRFSAGESVVQRRPAS